MDEDYFRQELDGRGSRDNLFLWTVFILLLIGAALVCWLGSFYVFGHPEKPRSYRILQKLKKIEPPRRFEITAAPLGEFLTPPKYFERYSSFTKLQLQRENDELLRNYINNYQETKKLVPYMVGRFNILDSFELSTSDMFGSGVVALAQAVDFPQVLIEHVYTAEAANVPVLQKMLMTGLDIRLEKTLDLAAVIHIERLFDGRLQFTVVPLLYGSYKLKQGTGRFGLEPPVELQLEAGAPLVKEERLKGAYKKYAEHRKAVAPSTALAGGPPTKTPSASELVRIDSLPPVEEPPESVDVGANSKAIASASPKGPIDKPPFKGPPVAAVKPPPPANVPVATAATIPSPPPPRAPEPPPPATVQPNVPLQPFLASTPQRSTTTTTEGAWPTYEPGKMPRGKIVNLPEAAEMADRDVAGQRLYLRGQFVVTAPGENVAVLRAKAGENSKVPSDAARIIVEFPAGAAAPIEGALFARDETRPFEIRDVQRGADGQINIYVREIIAP